MKTPPHPRGLGWARDSRKGRARKGGKRDAVSQLLQSRGGSKPHKVLTKKARRRRKR